MIPILNSRGEETGQFQKTLADELLKNYTDIFAIEINGKKIPVWWFIERYHKVINKKKKVVPFALNYAQICLYIELCEQRKKGEPMRLDVLKARQLGFSTFIASIIFTITIFAPNQNASIVADQRDHAKNLFEKYKFLYNTMPNWVKTLLPKLASNAYELSVDYGNGMKSSISVVTQGENAGRSTSCSALHLSEIAFWDNIESTLTSIQQTIDETDPNTLIIYETTANGFNEYKTIYDSDDWGYGKDTEDGSSFKALFYPWYYDQTYTVEDDRLKLIKIDWDKWKPFKDRYKLTNNQVAWYVMKLRQFRGNEEMMRQEFPSNPTEAFVTSGNSVFQQELVNQRKQEVKKLGWLKRGYFSYQKQVSLDGKRISISNIKWVEDKEGAIKIYVEPQDRHPYVVNNDVAQGGEDYNVTQVINNYTGHQVAIFRKRKCDADEVAFQMYCLAMYYNKALVSGETNTTSYVLELVRNCGYRKIYQDQDVEDLSGRYANKLGYKTKQNNRPYQIGLLNEAFRDNPEIIHDYDTLVEMENFQYVATGKLNKDGTPKEKAQATGGFHDDTVMALCGCYLCRHAQSFVPDVQNTTEIGVLTQEKWEEHLRNLNKNNVVQKGDFIQWD